MLKTTTIKRLLDGCHQAYGVCLQTVANYWPSAPQDLLTNPLIVPVKILRGHQVVEAQGVLDVAFHPTQPWLFSAGADSTINLYTNS